MTEPNWSKVPIEHTRIQVHLCRNNHRILRLPNKSNQFSTRVTLQSRSLRAIWVGTLKCVDDDIHRLVDENGSTLVLVPRDGPLDETEASSLSASGYREVRNNLRDSVTGRGYYKPESSRFDKKVRKTLFAKGPFRRDRNVRTPFREKTKEHGTDRITGAEHRKRSRCYRCQQLGHMVRECQNQASKDHPQAAAKSFFHAT